MSQPETDDEADGFRSFFLALFGAVILVGGTWLTTTLLTLLESNLR